MLIRLSRDESIVRGIGLRSSIDIHVTIVTVENKKRKTEKYVCMTTVFVLY
jgi:hypothetical protein